MTDLPRCTLCGCLPDRNPKDSLYFDEVYCSNSDCNISAASIKESEWCKLMGEHDIERENAEPSADLYELARAVKTVNRSARHRILVVGDDEPCYWQRKEWVEWIVGLADKALGEKQ